MAKKKSIRYICPCCYGTVNLNQIHHSCSNPACAREFLDKCNAYERRRFGSQYVPDMEIDVEKSEFLGLDPRGPDAKTTADHIIRGSPNGACDICKNKNTTKLCPNCHTPITPGAEETGTTIFVLLGSKNTGKSHYLTSLVRVLESSYSDEFGIGFEPASEKTNQKFDKNYRNRAFVEGKCLPPTPSYTELRTRDPLLYNLVAENEEDNRTVAFFDTSGEDLDLTNNLAFLNIKDYISGASGIVFLVDPMQVPGIRTLLGLPSQEKELPDLADTLNYISEIIRDNNKLKPKDDIDVPLAVVLTKVDLLMRTPVLGESEDAFFGPESSLFVERDEGITDTVNIRQISTEVEEYLRRHIGQEFIDSCDQYSNRQFFAVSAIGSDPVEGKLIKGISPYRVEDPFIWFMNSNDRRRWF